MAAAWERGLSVIEKLVASAAYAADFDAHEVNLSARKSPSLVAGAHMHIRIIPIFRLRALVRLSLVIDFERPKRDPRVSTVGC